MQIYFMSYFVVDLETTPIKFEDEEILEYLIEKKFPKGIHPVFSKIIVIGLKDSSQNVIKILRNEDEETLLKEFWEIIENVNPDRIITWNGYSFDIPFIEVRSRLNGIKISYEINTNKWNMLNSNHLDLMRLLAGGNDNFLNIRLDIACSILGIEHNRKITGREIEGLYKNQDWESIEKHCKEDVRMVEEIYKKLEPTIQKFEDQEEQATKKQVDYIMNIAENKNVPLDREEVEEWTKEEASKWIDEYKD